MIFLTVHSVCTIQTEVSERITHYLQFFKVTSLIMLRLQETNSLLVWFLNDLLQYLQKIGEFIHLPSILSNNLTIKSS